MVTKHTEKSLEYPNALRQAVRIFVTITVVLSDFGAPTVRIGITSASLDASIFMSAHLYRSRETFHVHFSLLQEPEFVKACRPSRLCNLQLHDDS